LSTCLLCNAQVDVETDLGWRKDGYDIVRCPSCGLVFRAELPDEQALSQIYDENYFRDQPDRADRHGYADYLRDASLHRANARRRLGLLATLMPRPGRLLDVGCAAGFFVDEARRAGWEASGMDVSAAMVNWARSELGAPVIRANFAQTDVAQPLFDAITMWDYIEHSIDPRRDFGKAREHLRPGGILALSTGDIGTLSARLAGHRWHLLTPEHHNFFFETKTLRRLLEDTGFDVLEARHRASVYSVGHVLYKLAASGRLGAVRRAASRLGRSSVGHAGVPINLYDIVTVVARRR
jgi:2-polyprenyl-3-methyl-5-hydroxy-6-metoxy-1,4-benzoquinol methylase